MPPKKSHRIVDDLNNLNTEEEIDLGPSKTKRKEQMHEIQKLGVELTTLSKDQLAKLDLPDILLDAIKLAQKITSNGAISRQRQYIGKLMRDVDVEAIQDKLMYIRGESIKSTKLLHLSQKWREDLLDSDDTINQFIAQYSDFDIGELRQLIRQVRKERENLQNRNYRNLFQFIRNIIERTI